MEELLPLLIFFVVVVAARLSPSRPSSYPSSPAPPPPPAAAAAAAAAAIIIISLFLFLPFACPVVTPPLAAATASLAAATVTPSYLHRERAAEVSPREDLRQGVQKGREASHFTFLARQVSQAAPLASIGLSGRTDPPGVVSRSALSALVVGGGVLIAVLAGRSVGRSVGRLVG